MMINEGLSFKDNTLYSINSLVSHTTKNKSFGKKHFETNIYPKLMSFPIIDGVEQIPSFNSNDFNGDFYHRLISTSLTPVVIKGFLKNSRACKDWNVEYFHNNFANTEIMLRPLKKDMTFDISHRPGKLKEVTEGILKGKIDQKYIMNTADILTQNPGLEKMLPMARVKEIFKKSKIFVGTQLFLGGKKTGSGIHCASGYNIFMNVYGRKKWTVIHPRYTAWLYPEFRSDGFYALSPVLHHLSKKEIEEKHPLYNRIPKMTYELEPGDALINPSWYWHAVDNLTSETIGVACRCSPPKPWVELNKLYTAKQMLTPHIWKVWKHLLSGQRLKDHFNEF